MTTAMYSESSVLFQSGNSTNVRLKKAVLDQAGFSSDSQVVITVERRGRIVIETAARRETLDEMLERFPVELTGVEFAPSDLVGLERI